MIDKPRILCYGDSNTWGYNNGQRFPSNNRWPGVLQEQVKDTYEVVENGLNGRTTALNDPKQPWLNGLSQLNSVLQANKPLDWVCLMLGTNDLNKQYQQSVNQILENTGSLVKAIQSSESGSGGGQSAPKVLLISPPIFNPVGLENSTSFPYDKFEKTVQLALQLPQKAQQWGCEMLPAAVVSRNTQDGIHLGALEQATLGGAVAQYIKMSDTKARMLPARVPESAVQAEASVYT